MEGKVWKVRGVVGFDGFQIMGDVKKGIKIIWYGTVRINIFSFVYGWYFLSGQIYNGILLVKFLNFLLIIGGGLNCCSFIVILNEIKDCYIFLVLKNYYNKFLRN